MVFNAKTKKATAESSYYEFFAKDTHKNLDPSFKKVFGGHFNVEGVEALLRGRYFDNAGSVMVTFEVINFKTGMMVGRQEVSIDKKISLIVFP